MREYFCTTKNDKSNENVRAFLDNTAVLMLLGIISYLLIKLWDDDFNQSFSKAFAN